MGDAPALGNIEMEGFRQRLGSLAGNIVSPRTEGNEQFALRIKGQVTVHHGADADRTDARQRHVVAALHVGGQLGIAGLNPLPYFIQRIGPHAVAQGVFPAVAARSDGLAVVIDENRLDAGRAEFNS